MNSDNNVPAVDIEIIKPLREAWQHMKGMLFPFELGKWFTLGFVAWLATLGHGGAANFNFGRRFNLTGYSGQGAGKFPSVPSPEALLEGPLRFARENLSLVLIVGAAVALLLLGLYVAITYINSRGIFVYLDCAYERKAKVAEPWRHVRKHAWSYFLWRLLIDGVGITLSLAIVLAILIPNWPALRSGRLTGQAIAGLIVGAAFFLALAVIFGLARWCLHNLVSTIMYLHDFSGKEAWSELFTLMRGHLGEFFLYFLMQFVLIMLPAIVLVPAACCCCALVVLVLPVVRQTILQPLLLWIRAYPFYFLAQFGGPLSACRGTGAQAV